MGSVSSVQGSDDGRENVKYHGNDTNSGFDKIKK
jgi:hypothetical protein